MMQAMQPWICLQPRIRSWLSCGTTRATRNMIGYSRGDIVLVSFIFSDQSGAKLRPALVVSSAAYHASRQDVVVAAITSNVRRRLVGDHRVIDWRGAGLVFPSMVTGIYRTIKGAAINR